MKRVEEHTSSFGDAKVQPLKKQLRQPITEEICKKTTRKKPVKRRPNGFFSKMSDDELVAYAERFIEENGIKSRYEFSIKDGSLYVTLRRRNLHGRIRVERDERHWSKYSDDELVAYAERFIEEKGIKSKKGLSDKDKGLYEGLRARGLLDRLDFKEKRRKPGFFKKMSDEKLVELARKFIEKEGIKASGQLRKKDRGLYSGLWKRGLLNRITFEERPRNWRSMSDEEIVEHAGKVIKEKRIKSRNALCEKDKGLYNTLRKRKLLDRLNFESDERAWRKYTDDGLVEYAQKVIDEQEIRSRKELKEKDSGLYGVLLRRKLLDRIKLKNDAKFWWRYSNDEVVEYAKKVIEEQGVQSRKELFTEWGGLYQALAKRGLLKQIKLKNDESGWRKYGDDEIIENAQGLIDEVGISSKSGLKKYDGPLFGVLARRKLLDKLKFGSKIRKKRNWASMSNEEILEYAKKLIEKKKIKNRRGLQQEDGGLHRILRERKLLDGVGLEKRKQRKPRKWSSMSDDALVEHAKRIIEEEGIKNRSGLQKKDYGLCNALSRRKLLDRLGLKTKKRHKTRKWASMSDYELLLFTKNFIDEKGIENRSGLKKEDGGLYEVLRKRKLINRVFVPLDKAKEKQAVQDVFDALQEFGGSE